LFPPPGIYNPYFEQFKNYCFFLPFSLGLFFGLRQTLYPALFARLYFHGFLSPPFFRTPLRPLLYSPHNVPHGLISPRFLSQKIGTLVPPQCVWLGPFPPQRFVFPPPPPSVSCVVFSSVPPRTLASKNPLHNPENHSFLAIFPRECCFLNWSIPPKLNLWALSFFLLGGRAFCFSICYPMSRSGVSHFPPVLTCLTQFEAAPPPPQDFHLGYFFLPAFLNMAKRTLQ